METAPLWIGIDAAKDQLDIPIGASAESWSVVFRVLITVGAAPLPSSSPSS
jgi:hypothetical protein